MGSLQAQEMAARTDIDTALTWHLTSNHFPPLPLTFLPVCKKAIELANKAIDQSGFNSSEEDRALWETMVDLPEGVNDAQTGEPQTTVARLVEVLHLDGFLHVVEEPEPEPSEPAADVLARWCEHHGWNNDQALIALQGFIDEQNLGDALSAYLAELNLDAKEGG